MQGMIDLHTHSVYSDGTTSPADNAAMAIRGGLSGLALTDHDTCEGLAEAAGACADHGLAFIPGIELSCEHEGFSVHLLGYWVDPDDEALTAECDRLRDERLHRARAILAKLDALGMPVTFDAVQSRAGGAPVGRPHIAGALVAAGHVPDLQGAFDAYLRDGGPAYVEKHALAPGDGLALLRGAGAAVVLAHPGLSERGRQGRRGRMAAGSVDIALVDELLAGGLAGIEVDHPGHDADALARWRGVAVERELLITASSDFHGDNKDIRIGQRASSAAVVERLAEHADAARTRRAGTW